MPKRSHRLVNSCCVFDDYGRSDTKEERNGIFLLTPLSCEEPAALKLALLSALGERFDQWAVDIPWISCVKSSSWLVRKKFNSWSSRRLLPELICVLGNRYYRFHRECSWWNWFQNYYFPSCWCCQLSPTSFHFLNLEPCQKLLYKF